MDERKDGKFCPDCKYFRQHYFRYEHFYFPSGFGSCVNRRKKTKKVVRTVYSACPLFKPASKPGGENSVL